MKIEAKLLLSDEMREELADYAHEAWSGWMKYLYSKCALNSDGTATIPDWAITRWARQFTTDYIDLLEDEKNSDLEEADKIIAVIVRVLARHDNE